MENRLKRRCILQPNFNALLKTFGFLYLNHLEANKKSKPTYFEIVITWAWQPHIVFLLRGSARLARSLTKRNGSVWSSEGLLKIEMKVWFRSLTAKIWKRSYKPDWSSFLRRSSGFCMLRFCWAIPHKVTVVCRSHILIVLSVEQVMSRPSRDELLSILQTAFECPPNFSNWLAVWFGLQGVPIPTMTTPGSKLNH